MKLLNAVIKKPVTVILATILILALGALAGFNMSTSLLPDIGIPVLSVSVVYPGASADTVEKDVTAPLQRALKSVGGVTDLTTYSMENAATVVLYFDYGTDVKDKKPLVEEKLAGVALPGTANKPSVMEIDLNATPAATLSMYNESGDFARLAREANELKTALEAVDGVASVSLSGAPSYEIKVTPLILGGLSFDGAILLIAQALSGSQLDIPLGTVMANGEHVIVRNVAEVETAEQLKELPVVLPAAVWAPIRAQLPPESLPVLEQLGYKFPADPAASMVLPLKLMATVASPAAAFDSYSYVNGYRGVSLAVNKAQDANTSGVVGDVKKAAAAFKGESKLILLDDQAAFIDESVMNVLGSMVIGGVLAVVIIFMFLRNVKSSIVISITMPLSVVAALGLLFLCGVTLNMVSLGGLAVGIGMLVDNSIVVIESISRHRDKGENPYLAALNGTRSVAGSIFASTLTTVCVFFPIMFAGGLTAEIFTDLALAVIFSLSLSFIVSVTVIPALYCLLNRGRAYFLQGSVLDGPTLPANKDNSAAQADAVQVAEPLAPPSDAKLQTAQESAHSLTPQATEAIPQGLSASAQTAAMATNAIEQSQSPALQAAADSPHTAEKQTKQKPRRTLSKGKLMARIENFYARILPAFLRHKTATILTALGVFALSAALVFFTGTEFLPSVDSGLLEVNITAENAALDDLNKTAGDLAELIEGNVEGIDSLAVTVGKGSLLDLSPSGKIRVQLKKSGRTEKTVERIRELAKDVAGYKVSVKQIDGVVAVVTGGFGDGISVELKGGDLAVLKEISDKVQDELKDKEGFRLVYDSLSAKRTEVTVRLDRLKCARLGIDPDTVALTLRTGISGLTAGSIDEGKILVSFAAERVDTLEKLAAFTVGFTTEGGGAALPVTVADVATFDTVQSNASVSTSGGQYLATVTAETYGLDTGTASKTMEKTVKSVLKSYPGYTFASGGVQAYLSDAFGGLVVALVISFFLLYTVMAAQFESAIKPLIVMSSIPLSFTGAFVALGITGTALSVVSFIGIIMLMGVIVNNAIVMMDKIAALKKEGMSGHDAVVEGAKSRLRPILMTTLTTVLALFPLSLGMGSGGALMQPLGIVVMGGLIVGTAVTLLLIPVVYCAFTKIKYPPNDNSLKALQG